MTDLVTWLRATLAEDRQLCARGPHIEGCAGYTRSSQDWADTANCTCWIRRNLAITNAETAFLDTYERNDPTAPQLALKVIALAYDDRPGYQEQWRP